MRYRMKELYAGAAKPAAKTEVEDEAKAGTTESVVEEAANADGAIAVLEARGSEAETEIESECIDGKCKMCGNDI